MNCVANIVKYILYIFNLLFLVCGILLIVFGSLTLTTLGNLLTFSKSTSTNALPICIIVLGCVVFLVSFLGCCGAIKDNKCLVYCYSSSVFILFLLQIALLIYAWVAKNAFLNSMETIVNQAWDIHNDQPAYMDALQISFKCCGKYSVADYTSSGSNIPNSCCGSLTSVCIAEDAMSKPGCVYEFDNFWNKNFSIIKWAGLGVAIIELIAVLFACFLADSIGRARTV